MKKEISRNSSFELLRIIAMFLIVLSHYSVHGQIVSQNLDFSFCKLLLQSVVLGNLGVDIFVMITGYYTYNKEFNYTKIFKIIIHTLFYSILIYLIFMLLGVISFNIKDFIKALLPVTFGEYWFISVFFVLLLLTPFLNYFIEKITRKQHVMIILLFMLIWSIIPTLTTSPFYGNETLQFIMFYLIGAYLKKYPNNIISKNNNDRKFLLFCSILLFISMLLLNILAIRWNMFNHGTWFYIRESFLVIGISASLISIFSKLTISSKMINVLASTTFGIYLIHDNPYMEYLLWDVLFANGKYIYSTYIIGHMIVSVMAVFISCAFIEFFRLLLFGKLFDKISKFFGDKIELLVKFISTKLGKIIK